MDLTEELEKSEEVGEVNGLVLMDDTKAVPGVVQDVLTKYLVYI